jgi:hypothetical protein
MTQRTYHFTLAGLAALVASVSLAGTAVAQEPAGNLPFTNIYKRPAVSPYTVLGNVGYGAGFDEGNGGVNPLLYQQFIQPRMEQERQQTQMLRQNRQLGSLQNQVTNIQRDTSARMIDRSIRPTGHRATFMNTSHYYGNGNGGGRR